MLYTPSKYQKAIFEAYKKTNKNIAIEACPGSGKTQTLISLLGMTPKTKKVLFCAFNKSIATELAMKVPEFVKVSTLHSLGYKALLKHTNHKFILKDNKTFILAQKYVKFPDTLKSHGEKTFYTMMLCKVIDLYRMNKCKGEKDLENVLGAYSIDTGGDLIPVAVKLMESIDRYNSGSFRKEPQMIDFTDMLYLSDKLNTECFDNYNIVMFDESQDANRLQLSIIEKSIKKNGRLISVGDSKQCIYSFMGANSEVFETIKERPKTIILPLSFCYRCGTKIVDEANKVFNVIESPKGQHEGKVRIGTVEDIRKNDYVICRNNLPLINLYLWLTKRSIPCQIMGKDYGTSLIQILKKINGSKIEDDKIKKLLEEKYIDLKNKGIKNIRKSKQYRSYLEKLSILKIISSDFIGKSEISSAIELMFGNESKKDIVMLSTIHKSKGLEADRVFFMLRQEIPSKYAITKEELFSEQCLRYVAISRAKNELIYIDEVPFKCKENELENYLSYLNIDYKNLKKLY